MQGNAKAAAVRSGLLAVIAAFCVAGCDVDEGPAEEMGESLDEAGEEVQESTSDAGNAVEDACEDVREGVDAEDTDC